jgi:hypothetical protein
MERIGNIILNLDRRVIYLIVLITVFVPLVRPLGLPVTPTEEVRRAWQDIEDLEEGSVVLVSADYGAATIPETHTMFIALMHQCFQNNLKVIVIALVPQGAALASAGFETVLETQDSEGNPLYPDKEYGRDYVNLGYKAGGVAVMLGIGQSFAATFPQDINNTPVADLPLLRQVKSLGDCAYIFDIASVGYPEFWISYGSEREKVPLAVNCTAVSTAQYYPYYPDQIRGLIGGMKGAAEYEKLVGLPETLGRIPDAMRGMDAQTIVHIFIVLAIIVANFFYFMQQRRERAGGRG